MSPLLGKLTQITDARLFEGASKEDIDLFVESSDIALPNDHLKALRESNGATVYGGYARLFGINSTNCIDILEWNRSDYWKFAWEIRCRDYICFAETAWGDQYAYRIGYLQKGDARVYLLDGLSMTPEIVASSFKEFLESEFLRISTAPYDEMMVHARNKFGDLEPENHLIYSPSLLIGGPEDVNNIMIIQGRTAMIFNGDIASQLDAAPVSSVITAVVPYDDDVGRPRLKLVWS
ncbi:SMI1/KNR4 family protein [Inquilinus sp. CA228]|uniref:SMI1/KNR4 family protein n=1 Tax=Inquilinus sp. CA228 TaxID=3455609 RepID=UPI003F8D1CF7